MRKAYAYLRVKPTALPGRINDLALKRKMIHAYCKTHHLELIQTFEDRGSNADISRKGLLHLLAALSTGNSVVVTHTNQLWEDDTARVLVAYQLRKAHAEIISIEEPSYSLYNDFSAAFSATDMDGLLKLHEKLSTGLRLSRGRALKAAQGERSCGTAPFGYKWAEGKVEVDPESKGVIRDIFESYLQVKSIGKLKRYLDENEITTPKGNYFSKEALRIILSNGFYAGFASDGANGKYGKQEPIVSEDVFQAAHGLLSSNRRNLHN